MGWIILVEAEVVIIVVKKTEITPRPKALRLDWTRGRMGSVKLF